MKLDRRGVTLVEALVAMGLTAALMTAVSQLGVSTMEAFRSTRSSLEYAALAVRLENIVMNDEFCTNALQGQVMNPLPKSVVLNRTPAGPVEFGAGTRFGSLTIQDITLNAMSSAYTPTAAGGLWPSRLTVTIDRADTKVPYTVELLLNVSTAASTFAIQKCYKIKFAENNYAAQTCPAAGPVPGCTSPSVPQILTVAPDGVTPMCFPDWTQCCAPGSYPVLPSGADPRTTSNVVYCRANYCNTTGTGGVVGWDTYAKGMCCSQGFNTGATTLDGAACP